MCLAYWQEVNRLMQTLKKLPVGIENFAEIQKNNFYYVDKTKLIEDLLAGWSKANLFVRPRRFGKSLNMSMLKSFFEIGCDKSLFNGLYIEKNIELCDSYMGKFPVLSISLKSINADSYEKAKALFIRLINTEVRRLQFLLASPKLTEIDKELLRQLLDNKMSEDTLIYSLRELTELLYKHYGRNTIILIDEYDVPLAKAHEQGYYDKMVLLVRNVLENALKTNDFLHFAVLTGCLRIAKESIFTGLNNFKVYAITNVAFDEYFGFTDAEVRDLLHYYGLDDKYSLVKEWYDGYRFGAIDIYCPWDVICYCDDLRRDRNLEPQNYWLHTSSNEMLRHFLQSLGKAQQLTKLELERLLAGKVVQKEVVQELTYKELYTDRDNIWSALFMTGYLTQQSKADGRRYNLCIPNREIRNIVTEYLLDEFKNGLAKDGVAVNEFCMALLHGEAEQVQKLFTRFMKKTISVRDTFVRKPLKENFYHGILLGLLSYKSDWVVSSNKESGDGFCDIMINADDADIGIVIEVKYAEDDKLEAECRRALEQIAAKDYLATLRDDGVKHILQYAIACNKKECKVLLQKWDDDL